ncbi:MAG TPA: hypothetical protein VHK91_11845, partial [Flavisolibacter sp.]|nr:hypothetical protein [Flavisolibacter sp.]
GYNRKTNVITGREGLLMEYRYTPDGWIEFIPEKAPLKPAPVENVTIQFRSGLSNEWQWSVFQTPRTELKGGELYLNALPEGPGAFLGHKVTTGNFTATVKVHAKKSTAAAGIALIGDEKNNLTLWLDKDSVRIMQIRDGKETRLAGRKVNRQQKMELRLEVVQGKTVQFSWGAENKAAATWNQRVDIGFLPPWDRAVRIGLTAKGTETEQAVFDSFRIINH